ncbi:MAG: tetratricopeptide repeat protein [Clostridiales bacterium]|nr:tetratricopeptide repeat protein [Clostridiales bacterium]
MGFMNGFKARKAMMKHQKGNIEEAKADYKALYESGYISATYLMPYTVLLLRDGGEENYNKVKEILKACEKAPDLTQDKRQQLWVNYAVAQYKLGEMEKAINLLEKAHHKGANGMIYGALGFLYIEAGDKEKAMAYNMEAYEYDEEDAVLLDNLAQTYYRLENNKEEARKYFEKAHEYKEGQIDTLYFLSLYDEEEGKIDDAIEKLEKALEGRFSPLNYANKARVEEKLAQLKAKK